MNHKVFKSKKLELAHSMMKIESMSTGLMAFAVLQSFRAMVHTSLIYLAISSLIYLAIPVLLAIYSFGGNWNSSGAIEKQINFWKIQCLAFLFSILPLAEQWVARWFGIGDAIELVAMMMIGNAAWFLSVFSQHKMLRRAGFTLSSCLVLFVCFASNTPSVFVLSFLFAVMSIWWLMGDNWARVHSKSIQSPSAMIPLRGATTLVTTLILAAVALMAWFAGPMVQSTALRGWMPFSGGDQWQDDFARSGIGDSGDQLTAGTDAKTTGPVQSDEFIEDNQPSIYDLISDQYDLPKKPINEEKRNRAVSFQGSAKHMHNVKQSEFSQGEFDTVRNPVEKKQKREIEERIAEAQFFVSGPVPKRFAITTFNKFNGRKWSHQKVEDSSRKINLTRNQKGAVYKVFARNANYFGDTHHHQVKLLRIKTSSIPAPPFMSQWQIDHVDQLDLFRIGERGLVEIEGGNIAPQTIIDLDGSTLDYRQLRRSDFKNGFQLETKESSRLEYFTSFFSTPKPSYPPLAPTEIDLVFSEVTTLPGQMELAKLVNDWTDGFEQGWPEVEAIVSNFRENFSLNESVTPPAECQDSIGYFLEKKSGPAYLFATTATQALRTAGYRTRLASGFLVQQEDLDKSTGDSVVTFENVHVWPEVCVDGVHWIPVEPTPSFPIPFNNPSLLERTAALTKLILISIWKNPILSLTTLALVIGLVIFRMEIFALICWIQWALVGTLSPNRRLKATRQLIDRRFWIAGIPRPQNVVIGDWIQRVEPVASKGFLEMWNRQCYSNSKMNFDSRKINDACRNAIGKLGFDKIKSFSKTIKKNDYASDH